KGKKLILPIVKRELQVIFDDTVDPEFGTGAVKVTPAHDHADFAMGLKHDLECINVMNPDGTINELGGDYEGMDRFECRETIVDDLTQRKLFIKYEKHQHAVGHCYRCHTIVEPRLSQQWFVRMKPLAKEAIEVVKDGKITFYPNRWTKVYLNWMENIRDWCISRQIWWGHRIPVWYCKDCLKYKDVRDVEVSGPGKKGVFICEHTHSDGAVKCPDCGGSNVEQDPDVLDTWFSSWLWPISTLGWPKETEELKTFYPTDALVTAQEIIFFWVARMIMAGLMFRGEIPFKDVYIHGTVRDATGAKMSKSLGNVIDPLDIIAKVGSDALRFSIISITSQGQDVFLSEEKFEFGRNFANKLWNASRFVLMNLEVDEIPENAVGIGASLADKWIISSYHAAIDEVQKSLVSYKFNEAAQTLYDFVWHKYCDWFLELSKLSDNKEDTQKVLLYVLSGVLRLLHPFMPFITEEIWQKLPGEKNKWVMTADWPVSDETMIRPGVVAEMDKLIGIITAIRNIRAFWNIDAGTIIDVDFVIPTDADGKFIAGGAKYIERLARCRVRNTGKDIKRPVDSIAAVVEKIRLFIPIGNAIDVEKEKKRIRKKIEEMENVLISIERKLSNSDFIQRAPKEVVAKDREKREKYIRDIKTLKENLEAVG
ncbi:MAG TPA: valine--tRNA ligase, partial [Candidatus Omnitrophota bacterium]|nr:valine--tRNA ligase [Candidatus Omnitrophota bacterium]